MQDGRFNVMQLECRFHDHRMLLVYVPLCSRLLELSESWQLLYVGGEDKLMKRKRMGRMLVAVTFCF